MSQTITVPDFWILFNPEGLAEGSTYGSHLDGTVANATAEDAWESLVDTKREREKKKRQGWLIAPIAQADWYDYYTRNRKYEPAAPAPELTSSGETS